MNKIIQLIIIYFFILISSANSDTIKELLIDGNKRISKETIKVLANIDVGIDLNQSDLNILLKKLYDSNFFEDIDFIFKNNVLQIIVKENPIIESIKIEGIKNKEFEKFLYDNMLLKNQTSYSELNLSKDINLIQNIMKNRGYYFSKIDPEIMKNSELNSVNLIININQGKKTKIKKITFIGDKKIKDKKLLQLISSEEHKFWKFLSNKVYLNQSLINLDKRLLENFHKNLGYYNVKVNQSFAEFDRSNGHFNLIFNIDTGEKFIFNDLRLFLPEDYNRSDFSEIENLFSKLKGKDYSLNDLNDILSLIDKIASSKLYEFIDVKVNEKISDQNKIDFDFNVVDSDKYYVEKINIYGNYQTIEEVIRKKLIVDEGDPFNNLLFNKSIDQIKNLRIFKKVDSSVYNGSSDNFKIIDIIVEEQPTGEISLAAGVGTSGSSIGGGINEKNFLGKGIDLKANLEISEDSLKGRFFYSKPNFAYTDNTLLASLESTESDFLTDFGYKVSNSGISLGTEIEQFENIYFSPKVSFMIEDLKTNSTASKQLKKQEGNYQDLYFNYGLRYDLRDSIYDTKSGTDTSFYQELPIISDNNEISNTILFSKYKTISKSSQMVGKANLYLKAINTLDGSDVRISKRGQIPYSRMRGFEKGKIGPVDGTDYIGGNYISSLNLSTNLPNILSTVEILDFNYFIDIGNVWGVDYDDSIDDSNFFRSSTGIAVDFITPIGPMNFSFTQPITKKSSDKTETFRFNLGTTF